MSILIKNMEIPEHCGYCRFRYDGICHALQKTQYAVTDCPLVSVPTPHGRLIDADELIDSLPVDYPSVVMAINTAPTIVPAEVKEE